MELKQNMRILAVDDEPVFLEVLEENLKQIGCEDAVFCRSAHQALRVLQDDPEEFDCMLVDIKMPGMDGIEFCRHALALPRCKTTPVLMLTAMSERHYVDAAFMAGASDYINKPLNRDELAARLWSAQALRLERQRVAALSTMQMGAHGAARTLKFSDAVAMTDIKGIMELVALKNYALTMGNLRMLNWKAVGFSVSGAPEFFGASGPAQYLEMMQDVGSVLFDVLKRGRFMMAHAGSGCFVALLGRDQTSDLSDLETQANALLDPFNDFYQAFSPVPVQIVIGKPMQNGLLSFQPADRPIDRAIQSVLHAGSTALRSDLTQYTATHA